jgi:hypothetical protein
MSEEELQDIVNAVGSMAEILRLMRDALGRNGFDQDETLYLLGVYMEVLAK